MFTVTFYSFKGGVGRTLALMNVAAELAKTGNNVAVLDFDLEAPGLNTFDCFKDDLSKFGLLDFIANYSESYNSDKPEIPDLKNYISPAPKSAFSKFSEGRESFTPSKRTGRVWLMPAKGTHSKAELSQIRIKDLYEKKNGYLLFEELRLRIMQHTKADYLLVDSRTGYADHSYVCTNQLADALAVIFFPNIQNQDGVQEIIGKVRKAGKVPSENILFVASRIPTGDDENQVLSEKMSQFSKSLHIRDQSSILRLHHNASFELLDQQLFSLTKTATTQLYRDYSNLADQIEKLNPHSRRGTILNLRDETINRQRYTPSFFQSSYNRANPDAIPRPHIYKPADSDTYLLRATLTFIDDVAVNTELANFHTGNRRTRYVPRGFSTRPFLHRLNAFLLFEKNISGLTSDASDPFEVLEAFTRANLDFDAIDNISFEKLWKHEYLDDASLMQSENAQAQDGELNRINEAMKRIPHATIPIGRLLDGVVDAAMTKLPNRLSGEKKDSRWWRTTNLQNLQAVFLSKRHEEYKIGEGEVNKLLDWSDVELSVIDSVSPEYVVYRQLDLAFSKQRGVVQTNEAYEAIRASLKWHFHDFGTARAREAHLTFLESVGTNAFKSWTPSTAWTYLNQQVAHSNPFLSVYLPTLLAAFQDEEFESIPPLNPYEALESFFDEDADDLPPNRFAGLCIIQKLFDVALFDDEDEIDDTKFQAAGINEYLANREKADQRLLVSADRVSGLQKEIKKLKEDAGNTLSAREVPEGEGTDLNSIMIEEQEEQLRYLSANFRQLQHRTSLFGHYFSYLSFSQVAANELFDELKTIRDSSKNDLLKIIYHNLYNKNNV